MDELKVTKENALAAHAEANQKGKSLLENLFGKKVFQREVTERIKTFDDVLSELGIHPDDFALDVCDIPQDEVAYRKLKMLVKVLNEGWQPDWADSSQPKYYPWFNFSSGRGLSYYDYVHVYTYSNVGSRLCFKSSKLAIYAGKQFTSIYADFMTFQ